VRFEWLATEEAGFYVISWLAAFLLAVFRILSSDKSLPLRVIIGSSGTTAFFAFAVTAFLVGRSDTNNFSHHFYYLAVSVVVGMMGPINQKMYQLLATKFMGFLGPAFLKALNDHNQKDSNGEESEKSDL